MAKKSLLVEDEPDISKITTARLKNAGYVVVNAIDGEIGLNMMYLEKPDLVLLDLVMPRVDGYEVCRRKNEDKIIKNIPVILFTASFPSNTMSEKVVKLAAKDYITKPFDAKVLIEKIKKILDE